VFLFFRIFTKTCLNCSASTEGPADKEATNFVKFLGLNAEWSSVMERWLEFFKELLEFWLFSEAFYNSTGLRGVSDLNLAVSFAPVRTIPQCAKASAAILNIFVSMFNDLERLLYRLARMSILSIQPLFKISKSGVGKANESKVFLMLCKAFLTLLCWT